jgi:hypothetical protein
MERCRDSASCSPGAAQSPRAPPNPRAPGLELRTRDRERRAAGTPGRRGASRRSCGGCARAAGVPRTGTRPAAPRRPASGARRQAVRAQGLGSCAGFGFMRRIWVHAQCRRAPAGPRARVRQGAGRGGRGRCQRHARPALCRKALQRVQPCPRAPPRQRRARSGGGGARALARRALPQGCAGVSPPPEIEQTLHT